MANSCVDSLPRMIAPAWRSFATTAASAAATLSDQDLRMAGRRQAGDIDDVLDADWHAMQRAAHASRGDLASAARAASIAASASSRMNACSFGSSRSIRASSAVSSSTGESCAARRTARTASAAVSQCRSVIARSPPASAARVRRLGRSDSRCRPGCPAPVRRPARRRPGTPPAPCQARRPRASFAISSLSMTILLRLPAPIMRIDGARAEARRKKEAARRWPHRPEGVAPLRRDIGEETGHRPKPAP